MLKRIKEELIVANYGSRNHVTMWTKVKVLETYKRLEERRKKDPTAPKKPDYPEVVVPVKQSLLIKRSVQPTVPTVAIFYQRNKAKTDGCRRRADSSGLYYEDGPSGGYNSRKC
ncbi:hypothetical protein HanIR_Chr12g0566281 [Helianthus annuus]|nr:hypothetical protein HanIR_Chr12g0566281 [Helianthus annuus]